MSDRSTPGSPPEGRVRPRPVKPTSVRDLSRGPSPAPSEIEPETGTFEVDGAVWTVEVAGRSMAAFSGSARTMLQLLRCVPRAPAPDEGSEVEAWVVGRSLADVSEERFAEALQRSRPWRGAERERSFFDDIGGQRRR